MKGQGAHKEGVLLSSRKPKGRTWEKGGSVGAVLLQWLIVGPQMGWTLNAYLNERKQQANQSSQNDHESCLLHFKNPNTLLMVFISRGAFIYVSGPKMELSRSQ